LDRVIPGVRGAKLKALFADCGWNVLECKYGAQLQAAFTQPGGEALRLCIDDMSNEAYQSLIRSDPQTIRATLAQEENGASIARCIAAVPDENLAGLLSNLGGHDIGELLRTLNTASQHHSISSPPTVIFAYTIKGYGLPIAGDPSNHAALLSGERLGQVRAGFGLTEATQWSAFEPDSPEGQWCKARAVQLQLWRPAKAPAVSTSDVPVEINAIAGAASAMSTQEAFGRIMLRLVDVPKVGERVITSSADVSVSTNLGGWINKVGAFALKESTDYEEGRSRVLNWKPNPRGQHIEFGIAEMNLFTALGAFGLSHEHNGQLLFPIGTVYDPFVARGLDAIIHSVYSGSKMIFVATPSGVSLAPEGGAHQSSITASIGIELPELDFWEPCFALEAEWALLEALRQCCDRKHGRSSYLRLSTKPIEQSLMGPALARLGREELRRQALAGGYTLTSSLFEGRGVALNLVTTGAMVPECLQAAAHLEDEGVSVNLVHLTSPRRAFENREHVASLVPSEWRTAPILTVHDAASHALAWVGGVFGQRTHSLGVNKFGQSGYREDVYRYVHIDVESIVAAGFGLVDE
jgi:pyruvate dehydrogenase E1 component